MANAEDHAGGLAQGRHPNVLRVISSQLLTPTELYTEQKLRVAASLRGKISPINRLTASRFFERQHLWLPLSTYQHA